MVLRGEFGKGSFADTANFQAEIITTAPRIQPLTAESHRGAGHLRNKSHDGKSESGRSSLPSMLQSMKNQMTAGIAAAGGQ